jgi:hypothetical protein
MASNDLKQLPEFKSNLQDLFCRFILSFQDNRIEPFTLTPGGPGVFSSESGHCPKGLGSI